MHTTSSNSLEPYCLATSRRVDGATLIRNVGGALLKRLVLLIAASVAALAISGCGFLLDGPNVACTDDLLVCADGCDIGTGDDGCEACICDEPPTGTACFDSDECADGERCDTENYCEAPPDCVDGQPCPDVCYGLCVDEPTDCTADSDCDDGERCRLGEPIIGDGAAPPGSDEESFREPEEDPLPAPPIEVGVCAPAECAERIALPACPPGTELIIDFSDAACGEARCVPSDGGGCRDLDPDACEFAPGCRIEELRGECDCGGAEGEADRIACECDVAIELLCVENETCGDLDEQACAASPDCIGDYYFTGCADSTCESGTSCDPAPCLESEEFVCTPRPSGGCFDNSDCPLGTVCFTQNVCTEVCWEAEDGSGGCEVDCWNEEGFCAPSEEGCWNLPIELCEQNGDCQLDWVSPPCECDPGTDSDCACPDIAEAVCVPRQQVECYSDNECGFGQFCDLEVTCADCTDNGDIGCAAPCFVEGVCRDGGPPPTTCLDGADCGPGFRCESVTICEDCAQTDPVDPNGGNGVAPAPCEGTCWEEGICVEDAIPGDLCLDDEYCGEGQRCATELDVCLCPEGDGTCFGAICYSQCVDIDPGDFCYSDYSCGNGQECVFEDPACSMGGSGGGPGAGLIACEGRCVEVNVDPPMTECFSDGDCSMLGADFTCVEIPGCDPSVDFCPSACQQTEDCLQVITSARNPDTGSCVEFATPCDVPPGWDVVMDCSNGNTP